MSIASILMLVTIQTQAMTIDDYMSLYKSKNSLLKANEMSAEATESKIDGAEIELAPIFTLGYLKNNDKSLPSQLSPNRSLEQYSVGLGKKFSTGTFLQLSGNSLGFENQNAAFSGFDKYSTGVLGVTVKQSLWRDSFGLGTRLKINRQKTAAELELTAADLQNRILIMDAEITFWDYVFSQEDLKLKKANLERAVKLQKWTSQRLSNGIGEKADDLNSKALVSLRQLQVLSAENELKNSENKLRQNLELGMTDKMPEISVTWKETRPYILDLKNKKNIIKIETYLTILEAKIKAMVSGEITDSLRPDLSIFGTYNYTSYNRDRKQSIDDISRPDFPQSTIGVNFTWAIDQFTGTDLRAAMVKENTAQNLKIDKKIKDNTISWSEYLRIYDTTLNQVKILEQISLLQKNRSDSENERFLKGRSITASVINAETDSAEAETNYLKAKVGLRKYEASSLMFMEWMTK